MKFKDGEFIRLEKMHYIQVERDASRNCTEYISTCDDGCDECSIDHVYDRNKNLTVRATLKEIFEGDFVWLACFTWVNDFVNGTKGYIPE